MTSEASLIPPGYVAYREAGKAFRQAVDRANAVRPRLNGTDRAVLDAVFAVTISRSRLEAESFNAWIAASTGLPVKEVGKRLSKLAELGIIKYSHSRAHGQQSRYAIPPADEPQGVGFTPPK